VLLGEIIEAAAIVDRADTGGGVLDESLRRRGYAGLEVVRLTGEQGATDFVRARFPGRRGRTTGGQAPTLGIVGRLGAAGYRPEQIGMVSDADGALVAVALMFKLAAMRAAGDEPDGDVIVATHLCPLGVGGRGGMMGAPVPGDRLLELEVLPEMEAVLSVDATKNNRVINRRGFALSPTVKEGAILPPAPDLLEIMSRVTGRPPAVFAVSVYDIAGARGLPRINSILLPATRTAAPVVGVALTTETAVPGTATGANQPADLEAAARFCLEVAKDFGRGRCAFFDAEHFAAFTARYGPLRALQGAGTPAASA
jgi:hypothetical protein